MKKFNSKSVLSTAGAYAIGGAGNAAMNLAVEKIDALKGLSPLVLGLVKIGVGVVGRSMTNQQIINQAADGIGIAGAGDIIQGLIDNTISLGSDDAGSASANGGAAGLPQGTIGRLRAGNRAFMRSRRVNGLPMEM